MLEILKLKYMHWIPKIAFISNHWVSDQMVLKTHKISSKYTRDNWLQFYTNAV